MDMNKLLDETKKAANIGSDYALAQFLDVDKRRISAIRKGIESPSLYARSKIARTLGIDEMKLTADIEAATEKNPIKKSYWEHWGKAASIAILLTPFYMSPTPANPSIGKALGATCVYYVKSAVEKLAKIKRKLRHAIGILFEPTITAFSLGIGQA